MIKGPKGGEGNGDSEGIGGGVSGDGERSLGMAGALEAWRRHLDFRSDKVPWVLR